MGIKKRKVLIKNEQRQKNIVKTVQMKKKNYDIVNVNLMLLLRDIKKAISMGLVFHPPLVQEIVKILRNFTFFFHFQ